MSKETKPLSEKGFEAHSEMEGAYWESDIKQTLKEFKEEIDVFRYSGETLKERNVNALLQKHFGELVG